MPNETRTFFEKYATEYDAMTDAVAREPKHRLEVESIIRRFSPTSVLDAGCGTGLTARLFAEKGIAAVGIDSSTEMIRLAQEKARLAKSPAHFESVSFETMPKSYAGSFDLIACLGNSISGVPNDQALGRTLKNFRRVLRPGGWLVLQLLNPAVINKGEPFAVRATRSGNILYHRYALRQDDLVALHVIRTDLGAVPPSFEAFVHSYRLLTAAQFRERLKKVGFDNIRSYVSLGFNSAAKTAPSRDLVITARRTS